MPVKAVRPKKLSPGEEELAQHLTIYKIEFEREFVFARPRRWRSDFCVPSAKLLIEVHGGTWSAGRHNRGKGFEEDARKANAATLLGYRILSFTSSMVHSGEAIDVIVQGVRCATT